MLNIYMNEGKERLQNVFLSLNITKKVNASQKYDSSSCQMSFGHLR